MDIQELNKTQMILLTLLITFVVSIATGIITVSLMQQMPKSVPQTINNVIQRTIEKVSTTPTTPTQVAESTKESTSLVADGDVVVSVYPSTVTPALAPVAGGQTTVVPVPADPKSDPSLPKALGQGIIISDIGLILVDSTILTDSTVYMVTLNKINFDATIIKKFENGFTILKMSTQKSSSEKTDTTDPTKAKSATQ